MDVVGPYQCKKITYHDRRRDDTPRLNLPISAHPDPGIKCEIFLRISKSIKTCLERTRTIQSELHPEEGSLWKIVISSWNEMPEEVLARTYSMHHQIGNAIIKHKG